MMNKRSSLLVILTLIAMLFSSPSNSQTNPISELDWEYGPTTGHIGSKATINVPNEYVFLGSKDTVKLMEMMENISSGNEYVFAPDDLRWFAVFEFDPVGYVKDNETLDPDFLLDSMVEGTNQGNIERRKRGWGTMTVMGWRFPPRYDDQANLLEWAFLAKQDSDNSEVINYNTRLLGRTGVMSVVLVTDPSMLDSSVMELKRTFNGYSFVSGEKYSEYKKGDRVAEFGLAALIVGGAAAVATKKGFWAILAGFLGAAWKFLAVAVVGLFAWIKSIFKSNK
jgi:uncharacterized membrane-anchored protein